MKVHTTTAAKGERAAGPGEYTGASNGPVLPPPLSLSGDWLEMIAGDVDINKPV